MFLCDKNVSTELPDDVSISPLNHTGPMVEGTEYQLQCDILNVAPVQNLTVTWYKGNETIKTDSYSDQSKTPVNESSILTITPSREDDGALYRCEAQLNLGPEGPHPSAIDSDFNLTVLCEFLTTHLMIEIELLCYFSPSPFICSLITNSPNRIKQCVACIWM